MIGTKEAPPFAMKAADQLHLQYRFNRTYRD
jgi:hypothetical protein